MDVGCGWDDGICSRNTSVIKVWNASEIYGKKIVIKMDDEVLKKIFMASEAKFYCFSLYGN